MKTFKKLYKKFSSIFLKKSLQEEKVQHVISDIEAQPPKRYRILCLSGGGAKGFYSLGFLKELENILGDNLNKKFDLVFGTSTGAIIATLICSGYKIDDIVSIYREGVPKIMSRITSKGRTETLISFVNKVFQNTTFDVLSPTVGVVATNKENITPVVFLSNVDSNVMKNSSSYPFINGGKFMISDIIQSSCAAHPFFKSKTLKIQNEEMTLIDGGYCGAVNPSIQACNYAINKLHVKPEDIDVVSVGVGHYPDPRKGLVSWILNKFILKYYAKKYTYIDDLDISERLSQLYPMVRNIHIDEEITDISMATDMLEKKSEMLDDLYILGKKAFIKNKDKLINIIMVN